ncbi:hypothetical protein TUM19329_34750 [Legionella antarctica]|uniref:Outer membrane protein n=1 Tax=Legionella antarctica TaxID=2708020 RepID=A0A6F8T8U4_9GAMM|nr:hypothetical protein [Legionella antarctica]BCA97114.1 hypothetical protein TUM19329_34750 [Legionella antarctica]
MRTNIFFSLLLLLSNAVDAQNQSLSVENKMKSEQEVEQLIQQYLQPKAIVTTFYDDFKFSSNQGAFFNQYSGHTNFVSVGGDNFKTYNFYWGLNFYNITTNTSALTRMTSILNQARQSFVDNGVYLHVMKHVFSPVFIDIFASFGRDNFTLSNTINGDTANPLTGFANYNGNDSTVGARTFFGQSYRSFYLRGDLTYFYSNFRQQNYTVIYPNQNVFVPSLKTKIGTTMEYARLYYQLNERVSPFVSGGFIQIVSRDFSRSITAANFGALSATPEVLLGRYGYGYGIGIDYHYKQLRIIPSYAHSVRGSTYHDNLVAINFQLSGMG